MQREVCLWFTIYTYTHINTHNKQHTHNNSTLFNMMHNWIHKHTCKYVCEWFGYVGEHNITLIVDNRNWGVMCYVAYFEDVCLCMCYVFICLRCECWRTTIIVGLILLGVCIHVCVVSHQTPYDNAQCVCLLRQFMDCELLLLFDCCTCAEVLCICVLQWMYKFVNVYDCMYCDRIYVDVFDQRLCRFVPCVEDPPCMFDDWLS